MFIETSLGKNAGEIKEEAPGIDLDLDMGKLCFSPAPLQSFRERADESSATIVTSDVSVADVLIPSLASIKFGEFPESEDARVYDTIKTDAIDSIWEANQPEQSTDEGKDSSRYNFPDFSRTEDPCKERDGNAVVLSDIDNTRKPNDSLIVYRSSREKSVCNTNNKINQKSESRNESRNCRKIEKKNSALDLNSLKISRRKRTLFPKRDRSSVWGLLGNSLSNSEETGGNDRNIGSNKNLGRIRGDQGKESADTAKVSKKLGRDWRPPTGRITLKIKIGSQSCGMVHVTEDFNAVEKNGSGLSKIASHEEGDKLRASAENGCSNPGTSPDSEVINTVPDTTIFKKGLSKQDTPRIPVESINQECLKNSVPDFPVVDGSSPIFIRKKSKQGVKKDKFHKFSLESMLTGAKPTSSAKAPAQPESGQEVVDLFCCNDPFTTATGEKYLNACSSNKGLKGPSCCSRMTDSGAPITSYICSSAEVHPSYDYVAPNESSSAQRSDNLILCTNGKKFSKCSKAKGHRKSKSESSDKTSKKERTSKKKSDRKNLFSRHVIDEKDDIDRDNGVGIHLVAGHESLSDLGETGYLSKGVNGSLNNLRYISDEPMEQYAPPRNAWVLCDECQKWRRIPAILADQIEETNCGWTCKDNTDRDFADCSIPQEKSNSEINKELEISDGEEDTCDALKSNQIHSQAVQKAPSWSLIGSNMFLHRSRKTQTIDEVMVCHCKTPTDGRMGCGAKCLNRMLNIECVRGTCPCGELCSNQQFQKRKYAKLMWFRCGKKGFGLQALQDISQGQFLIEYVGEVLDLRAYETRQKEYALQGHRHFYFMTLNGSEVIDACTKGNLGRFINHSCDPNCQTEKWMVNGEVCVGLFAVRDIKKGEEVTFDYNYVRVFGAAAKRCVCGSANCRGYIGGDPTSTEVIVQGDSDEEFAEPVMTCYDRHMKEDWNGIISNSLRGRKTEPISEPPEKRDSMKKQLNVAARSENITSETLFQKVAISSACSDGSFNMSTAKQAADMVPDDDEPEDSLSNDFSCNAAFGLLNAKKNQGEPLSISEPALSNAETEGLQIADALLQSEDVMNEALSLAQHTPRTEVTTKALASKSQPNGIDSKRKLKYPTLEGKKELVKSDSAVKARLPSSIKKEKLKSNLVSSKVSPDLDKSNAANLKSKCSSDVTINNHVETVEKKLNELLDTEGGISKRRDASRGYLKLLFLTAASGTSGQGEAIQSNRDLSMILDALLKTKSRTVLVDVINKNGLQMLHNIMKRYRKEFNKTPILRKLLKVLEYLATKGILNLDHITGGPPCPGVESFRDSIMTLTEHGDRQVNQIARNFRDRWIPRHLRRRCFMETNDARIEFPHNSGLGWPSVSSSHDLSNFRFEKSAQPVAESSGALDFPPSVPSTTTTTTNNNNGGITEPRVRKRKSRWDSPVQDYDSAPPGFLPPRNDESAPPGFSHPFNKKPNDRADDSFPRNTCTNPPFGTVLGNSLRKFTPSLPLSHGVPHSVLRQFGLHEAESATSLKPTPGLPFRPFPPLPAYPRVVPQTMPPKSGGPTSPKPVEKFDGKGACSVDPTGAHNLGRKFFRQQKSSHGKPAPPWVRIRNGQVHGGNTRSGGPTGAVQFRNY